MLNFQIVFAVIIALSSLTSAQAFPLQKRDLQRILEILAKGQGPKKYSAKETSESSSSDTSSSDDDNAGHTHILRNMDVIDLIEKADKKKKFFNPLNRNENINKKQNVYRNYEVNRHSESQTQQLLEQLLEDKRKKKENKRDHRLTPNHLLSPISMDYDGGENVFNRGRLDEYSQVYVVLDPLALEKSKNEDALSDMLSRIISQSSSANENSYPERNKSSRYKGFKVKNNLLTRRYRRDSKETFGRDSLEDDYKPKRSRNEHGGGTGGRTAIPYIRHRGDIYERDH